MDEFDAITAEMWAEERLGQLEHAREILAASDAVAGFDEVLRRLHPGEIVGVATVDGWSTRGRVVRIAERWIRVAEITDETGIARLRARCSHDIRMDAVVRVTREAGQ